MDKGYVNKQNLSM